MRKDPDMASAVAAIRTLLEFLKRDKGVFILFQNVPAALYTDPNEIAQHLTLKLTECEKLEFPVSEVVQ